MKRILFSTLFVFAACGGGSKKEPVAPAPEPAPPVAVTPAPEPEKAPEPAPPPAPKEATATLASASKSKVTGEIKFKEVDGGVEVTAHVEGLKAGDHGWHVHEKGDCSAPDASSAGGHFNPENHKHGGPDSEEHHAGDFGNLTAGKDGKADATFTMKGITLADGPTSIVGKGFIVHDKKDDLKGQPAGNAGNRVACGVINLNP
ncbi:MAG TPA: superoxide dismutase family protein [Kofleriaceae bacterium]|jgi:Cu-Zn family superoxide dismutase